MHQRPFCRFLSRRSSVGSGSADDCFIHVLAVHLQIAISPRHLRLGQRDRAQYPPALLLQVLTKKACYFLRCVRARGATGRGRKNQVDTPRPPHRSWGALLKFWQHGTSEMPACARSLSTTLGCRKHCASRLTGGVWGHLALLEREPVPRKHSITEKNLNRGLGREVSRQHDLKPSHLPSPS